MEYKTAYFNKDNVKANFAIADTKNIIAYTETAELAQLITDLLNKNFYASKK